MCGRFTLTATFSEIIDRFNIQAAIEEQLYEPSYNVAPSQSVLAVINDGKKNRLGYLRWGLIPPWAKDTKMGHKMINARAETIFEKPSFRQAFQKKRCIIIADSFYEWKRHGDQTKTPMRIKLANNRLFAMAGLWETWKSKDGQPIHTCTVITTNPNDLVKNIHDRMPVILNPEDEKIWLNPMINDTETLLNLLKPFPEDLMASHEVSSLVNSPKNNSIELIRDICS
ncbi:putative SOS response-associated peptidase YedK [Cytobacillus eiseniae]|uniref:Abasic site processing protein n=1 Tax=Cytobacillus eiseniae TaxID=762947 RepID=A0ABS4R9M0_9BACI|nr:SOS response-associated peptidase [Cytobacillus eiseniae]MBP2239592.1 putative SOS response-associated peptidase YedK [Cytobacillus eiseniae]